MQILRSKGGKARKLLYHRRDDEVYHTTKYQHNGEEGYQYAHGTPLYLHPVLYEVHQRVKQVSENPCYEKRQQYSAEVVEYQAYYHHEGNDYASSHRTVKCNRSFYHNVLSQKKNISPKVQKTFRTASI